MRLSGFVFVLVGAAVTATSWILSQRGQKMTLFLFVGVAMLTFGIIRLFIDRATNPQEKPQVQQPHTHTTKTGLCVKCGTRNHPQANFCGYCGNKL